ncbi:unnamed protein product [Lymnaea stagnalis]|uniref:Uncharacterized protein n=1 Tax=Lymnaea stagnalis TaxID=6523 RepID=A0AAV2HE62_LYMST
MDQKGEPPAYDAPGISNPNFNTVYSPPLGEPGTTGSTQPYAYPPPGPPMYMYPTQNVYGNTTVVAQPPLMQVNRVTSVPDNMILAVVSLFFFWPLGIAAIMKASESREALARNDVAQALQYSTEAKRYALFSIGLGIVGIIVMIIVLAVVLRSNYYYY